MRRSLAAGFIPNILRKRPLTGGARLHKNGEGSKACDVHRDVGGIPFAHKDCSESRGESPLSERQSVERQLILDLDHGRLAEILDRHQFRLGLCG